MTRIATAVSAEHDSATAGAELGRRLRADLDGEAADAVVVFASARHDYPALLAAILAESGAKALVGSSSAGEFSGSQSGQGQASALAIRSTDIKFSVGLGRNLSAGATAAAREVAQGFNGIEAPSHPYRCALVMTDALAGHADAVVEELTVATRGNYRFFGGGAGDDGKFSQTHVFAGSEAVTDAVVALEMLSTRPIGVGVSHGWVPASDGFRVTEVHGPRLVSLNGLPAADVVADHAQASGHAFDRKDALPYFLHNILGIRDGERFRLRVPLAVEDDGSIVLAADVPPGAIVHIMKTTDQSAVLAAQQATRSALEALQGAKPRAALVFDCVATRLRLGRAFDDELKACAELLRPAPFIGCNTYGQIARAEGQFGGFHNCTAVVCVLPE